MGEAAQEECREHSRAVYVRNGVDGDWFLNNVMLANGVKVKVKFTLEQAMKAQRGSRGIALLFL
jgi:hypothetical protein